MNNNHIKYGFILGKGLVVDIFIHMSNNKRREIPALT